jgi:adenylate cyclase
MATEEFKRKLTAILSADVEGYSRLMGEDEDATIRTLTTYRELMSTLIQKHRGRVVDSPGDNLLAEFGSVVDGVRCAVEIQEELRVRNAELPENRRMEFRIGVNLGDVVEEGERIYGDGVNITARVEGLAEGGGICISGTVYDSIKNKLSLSYESMGEHTVKNITEPVRVYRMRIGPEAAAPMEREEKKRPRRWRWASIVGVAVLIIIAGGLAIWNYYFRPTVEPASVEKMAFPLPDEPSIAVLPFANMSGDPQQDYLSDGLTGEIITSLSMVPRLFVIARNSTFTYKGKAVKVQQVAEELGVRYVLEGSVQKSGERIRISAQLIDALTGRHLWAQRYDRDPKDLFALHDEIIMKIMSAIQVKLTKGERARISARGTNNLEAYIKVMQAGDHINRRNKEGNIQARKLAEEAVALDPEYPSAYSYLGQTHVWDVWVGLSKSRRKSFQEAVKLYQKALAIDESHPHATGLLANAYAYQRQFEKALAQAERAVALNPDMAFPNAVLGAALFRMGRYEEAIQSLQKAIRLDPKGPGYYFIVLGEAYCFAERYEEAITNLKKAIGRAPNSASFRAALAAIYSIAGREEEARAEAAEVLRLNPKFSLEHYGKVIPFSKAQLEPWLEALRKVGLPETPPLPLPDKPSIAVLPFDNLSGDPKQEYLSDGITESIIIALSKTPRLFVIARNSTFTYKGKPVKVQQVRHELGVRYVLEGSVQRYVDYGVDPDKSGPMPMQKVDSLRITSQLVDAKTGYQIWAERYDRELRDIFALQDEIAKKIITAMQVKLTRGEIARVYAKGTDNLDAYLKFLQGWNHYMRANPDDAVLARRYFKEAIALDPEFATPYSFMGQIHLADVRRGLSKSPQKSIGKAFKLAQKVLALDESHSGGHILLGTIHLIKKQHEKATAAFERAIALEPNRPGSLFWLGVALSSTGRPQEAIPHFKRVIRLNPLDPSLGLLGLGSAYVRMERYEEAITVLKKALHYQPDFFIAHVRLAMCYAALGREEEARAEAAEVLRLNPKFSAKKLVKTMPIRDKAVKERYIDALRKAGLPD